MEEVMEFVKYPINGEMISTPMLGAM